MFPSYIRGVDFLGYRTFYKYTLLRKSTCLEMEKKMTAIRNKVEAGNMMNYSEWCSINSYKGWLKYADTFRLYQVSHSHDASLRGVWTINIQSPHEPFVKCSVFKSLYSFVHSQIAYKIKYFLIVQTLPPCASLCCISAMVASRWQCHR